MLEFNTHTTVVGLTQEGKTYAVTKSLLLKPQGALFFNTKRDEPPVKGYTEIRDGDEISIGRLYRMLEKGRKVAYWPSRVEAARSRELAYIIDAIYAHGKADIIIAVDEVHLFDKRGQKKLEELATTGLGLGYKGVFLSQRFANISKTLVTQSLEKVIFRTEMEGPYFRTYGLPQEAIREKLEQGGKYSFVIYDSKDLRGPFRV